MHHKSTHDQSTPHPKMAHTHENMPNYANPSHDLHLYPIPIHEPPLQHARMEQQPTPYLDDIELRMVQYKVLYDLPQYEPQL